MWLIERRVLFVVVVERRVFVVVGGGRGRGRGGGAAAAADMQAKFDTDYKPYILNKLVPYIAKFVASNLTKAFYNEEELPKIIGDFDAGEPAPKRRSGVAPGTPA